MRKTVSIIMIILGVIPLVVPVLLALYRMAIESWTFVDFVVLYSFIYWPTYIIGGAFSIIGIILLLRK